MPHVIVKLYAGKTEAQKQQLTQKIVEAVMSALGSSEASISVGVEEFDPKDWQAKVVQSDILGKPETIRKRPG